jgi:hypothetical protein
VGARDIAGARAKGEIVFIPVVPGLFGHPGLRFPDGQTAGPWNELGVTVQEASLPNHAATSE